MEDSMADTVGRLGWLVRGSAVLAAMVVATACGGDDDTSEAVRSGVGDSCVTSDDCIHNDQECLTEFKAGYCGLKNCTADVECPEGSACVTEGGINYCFLICVDKLDCNQRREPADEANCSSSVDFIDDTLNRKACVPPSGT